jgi:hypothetical protein
VRFTITELDQQYLAFSGLTGGMMTSGNAGTISVGMGMTVNSVKIKLFADPGSTVTVMCSVAPIAPTTTSGVSITGPGAGSYTFTSGSGSTWGDFQTIQIHVSGSSSVSGEAALITCNSSGGSPPVATRTFTVTVP